MGVSVSACSDFGRADGSSPTPRYGTLQKLVLIALLFCLDMKFVDAHNGKYLG